MKVKVTYYNRDMEKISTITSLPMKNRYGSYNEPMQSIFEDGFSVACENLITIEPIDETDKLTTH